MRPLILAVGCLMTTTPLAQVQGPRTDRLPDVREGTILLEPRKPILLDSGRLKPGEIFMPDGSVGVGGGGTGTGSGGPTAPAPGPGTNTGPQRFITPESMTSPRSLQRESLSR